MPYIIYGCLLRCFRNEGKNIYDLDENHVFWFRGKKISILHYGGKSGCAKGTVITCQEY